MDIHGKQEERIDYKLNIKKPELVYKKAELANNVPDVILILIFAYILTREVTYYFTMELICTILRHKWKKKYLLRVNSILSKIA